MRAWAYITGETLEKDDGIVQTGRITHEKKICVEIVRARSCIANDRAWSDALDAKNTVMATRTWMIAVLHAWSNVAVIQGPPTTSCECICINHICCVCIWCKCIIVYV